MIWKLYLLELLKLRKRLVTVGIYMVYLFLLFFSYGAMAWNRYDGNFKGSFQLPSAWQFIFGTGLLFTCVFSGALLILQTAGEFEWRTARQSIIDGLARKQWLLAKFMLVLTLACCFFVTQFVFSTALAVYATPALPVGWFGAVQASAFTGTLLAVVLACCIALLFAVLLRTAGIALGVALLSLLVDSIVDTTLRGFHQEALADLLPIQVIRQLGSYKLHEHGFTEVVGILNWPMSILFLAGGVWLLVLGGFTCWAFIKRDL